MSEELKVGDVVRLKSGGPQMVVDNIEKYDADADNPTGSSQVTCYWMREDDPRSVTVDPRCLTTK